MQKLVVAAVSCLNHIGQPQRSIADIERWAASAAQKGAELVLFFYSVVCNSAGDRQPNDWEPQGMKFPGWAGMISPWGRVMAFEDSDGNGEAIIVQDLDPAELQDRRGHANFLARELRPELYQFSE